MLEFIKYQSIENAYRQKFRNFIISEGLSGGHWVVQEKIHGANFGIYLDQGSIRAAKRNGFLEITEKFYNYDSLLVKYQTPLGLLMEELGECVLYCEIFGGSYQHKDVEPVKNTSRVQKGVQYCSQNEFMIYDILVSESFLNLSKVIDLCEQAGAPYIPILFQGSYGDCLNYTNEFQTTIPQIFNLPAIENNICEGIIIKPDQTKFLQGGNRVILKSKNERFSEKQKEKILPQFPLPENLRKIIDCLFRYVTDNRLRNVLSHLGVITNKDFGKILGELNKDIFKDYSAENGSLNALNKSDRKKVQRLVTSKSASLIRSNFLSIVEGDY